MDLGFAQQNQRIVTNQLIRLNRLGDVFLKKPAVMARCRSKLGQR